MISLRLCRLVMLVKVNYHWFPSDFATWLSWLWEIIIDFPQTLSRRHIGYGKLSLISLRLCHLVMLVMANYHWFPSDFVTWSCCLWLIIIDFPQTLSLGYVGYGKLSLIFLRICHVVMLVMGNYHWFLSDFVTWLLISLRLCHLVKLVMVNYHWFPSDFVKWSCWLREIIIDFPQTLSLGYVGYGKLSLIFLRICHVVILVMGNYHWFPSLCHLGIDFSQTSSLGHVGYG